MRERLCCGVLFQGVFIFFGKLNPKIYFVQFKVSFVWCGEAFSAENLVSDSRVNYRK